HFCMRCDRYQYGSDWKSLKREQMKTREELLKKLVLKNITFEEQIQKKDVEIKVHMAPAEKDCSVQITVKRPRQDEQYQIPFKIYFTVCPHCGIEKTQYFEGILQIRDPNDEVMQFVDKVFEQAKKRGVYINKKVPAKQGFDYYVTSQTFLSTMGNKLQERFGGTLKISSQLFTQNKLTSKQLYRVNVYFKAPPFKRGDVINHQGKLLKVTQLGKLVNCFDIINEKKTAFRYNLDERSLHHQELIILPREKTTIAKVYPHVEVLDADYQPVKIANQAVGEKKKYETGEKIEIVRWKHKVFLV
ncbi:TPA: hypothetical protein HA297_04870, partial [Candidatus Woesearchaeota archaeon]|nr:hypothetical protein [Candidatus Woesearchaeota archaeon]